ncbi:hypothetical protein JTB14_024646 [Gonioctena quinquepunctata]|nr:hypothetical protein JTB14_024646 [Gonioctena quinquepunctata]
MSDITLKQLMDGIIKNRTGIKGSIEASEPPSTNENEFVLELQNYLGQQRYKEHYFAIIGDINMNLFSDNNPTNDYLDILSESNFISTVNIGTRTQDESSTYIDHVFVRAQDGDLDNKCSSFVLDSHIPHHKATIVSLKTTDYHL